MAEIRATPRNEVLGWFADKAKASYSPERTQQMQGLMEMLSMPDIAKTLDRLSYGEPLTTGSGWTTQAKPETIGAAVAATGLIPSLKGLEAGTAAVGKAISPAVEKWTMAQLEKGTPIGQMLLDLSRGSRSNVLPEKRFQGGLLEGLPEAVDVGGKMERFGTDMRLVDIAKDVTEKSGFAYSPQLKYAELDVKRAERLAKAYDKMANNPSDPKVKKAYDKMIEETMAQYEALRKKGYKFDFMPESGDIYGNPRNAINDLILNKHMSVFPTEQGFGGASAAKALEANPLLMRVGEKWGGKEVTANDVFRAVHDAFGHAKHGVGFRARGEENAFQSHARMYSPEALPAVTSETRGQNSWVNFGPYGAKNRTASPIDTEYAEQKTGIMPPWTWREGLLK